MSEELETDVEFACKLLDRDVQEDYRDEWTRLLMRQKEEMRQAPISVVMFRLQEQWLALSTDAFKEVCEVRPIHTLPHRSNNLLLGLVNIRGQLRTCVALDKMLEIEEVEDLHRTNEAVYQRLVVLEDQTDRWVFPADEVHGISHFEQSDVHNVPVTVSKSTANFLKGMLEHDGKHMGFIDEELMFSGLRRVIK